MHNQTKWNKELLYSIIFFVSAIAIYYSDLLFQIFTSDFVLDSLWNIFNKLGLGSWYLASSLPASFITLILLILLFCSVYTGIKSLMKAPISDRRKIFVIVPQTIQGYIALIQILISSFVSVLLIIGLFYI